MGMVNRLASPIFIVLNVYLARRQVLVLVGNHGAQYKSRHLIFATSAALGALLISSELGFDSVWAACFSIVLIRLWVVMLSYEWQAWLPGSPSILVVISAAIWSIAAGLIAMEGVDLIVVTSIAICFNCVGILFMRRFRKIYE
jgi:hypothetical protein